MAGENGDCKHGLGPGECHACAQSEFVLVTKGGNHYHWFKDCRTLTEGQRQALVEGFKVHPIDRVSLSQAVADGRSQCRTCRDRRRGHRRRAL